jgi:hypothetical protein
LSKFHRETTQTKIMPELLAKEHLDVRLIIHHKYKKVHESPSSNQASLQPVTTMGPGKNTERYIPIG